MEDVTNPQTTLLTSKVPDKTVYFFLKRIIDLVVVITALIILSPLMLILAIIIKLESSGPAVFAQQRVSARRRIRNGQHIWEQYTFTFYKFRTMTNGASSSLHHQFVQAYIAGDEEEMARLRADKAAKDKYKISNDPRVTRIGRFLRKSSLDELPQLWNVLKGEIALVGPRPPIPYEVAMYKPWHHQRLEVMSGVTGLWQVEGRSATSFDEMVRMDIKYIEDQSTWLDLKILFLTIPVAVFGKGAR